MKKITRRTVVCLVLAALLVLGTGIFTAAFFIKGGTWAAFPSNRHLYAGGVLRAGTILDRDGFVLAAATEDGWEYCDNADLRKSTLHAVGDTQGKIGVGAINKFADQLTGYNFLTGAKPLFSSGRSLYLTIDAAACKVAYDAMKGNPGTVAVYNYKTGEILCMTSSPTFDPENVPEISGDDPAYEGVYVNRLLSSTLTPGSTFKLVTLAAVIEQMPDYATGTFHCDGTLTIGGQTLSCSHAHGDMTLGEALTVSCNCVFGQLTCDLGSDVMERYAAKAGLTVRYDINGIRTPASTFDFANEDAGILAWSGAGQGKDLVNPCALMVYAGAIANGGKAAVPRLISQVRTASGVKAGFQLTHRTDRLVNADTAAVMTEMMRNNVLNNYGQDNFPGLSICAKSGTAQTGAEKNDAWFVGFLEDEDHPYAFVAVIQGGGAGGKVAGKVINTVLQKLISDMDATG